MEFVIPVSSQDQLHPDPTFVTISTNSSLLTLLSARMRIQGEVRTNPIYIFVPFTSPSHERDAVHLAIPLTMSWTMDTILNGTERVEKKVRTLFLEVSVSIYRIICETSLVMLHI